MGKFLVSLVDWNRSPLLNFFKSESFTTVDKAVLTTAVLIVVGWLFASLAGL